ncbi:MAG: hypothetical protein K2H49_03250 [Muribaculaceae bacterium]|nr:hypothetical protein [Muribaculaceae bacterium]
MNRILTLLFAYILLVILPSCEIDSTDEPDPSEVKTRRTVLIYAVASNNLSSYLADDKKEMLKAAPDVYGLGSEVRVMLYSVNAQSASEATLSELAKNDAGQWDFIPVRSYDRNTYSTDPERMRQVYSDLLVESPSEAYGLIFWSHGTGWIPNFSEHEVPDKEGLKRSFGADGYQNVMDYCDIDELASAIPDHMFDYIWFDCCYMMGIETVYQLRDKCEYIGGYPTEDWSPGMNYEATLPLLASVNPDLAAVGETFFDHYNSKNMAVTVTVLSTSGLERLAQAAADIYAAGKRPESPFGLMNYSRLKTAMYDFGQYTKEFLDLKDEEMLSLEAEFNRALSDIIIYAGCSTKDFNNRENAFDPEMYSGLSCHFPGSSSLQAEEYYNSLDWTKRVKVKTRTVLIYAVASNNLASYLKEDKKEMIQAAADIKKLGDAVRVILYSIPSQSSTEAFLSELKYNEAGEYGFEDIKSYDRNTFSTDPVRMQEVYADLIEEAPADAYGLIFWSHGTGWIPNFTEHQVPNKEGLKRSFGTDRYQGVTDYCDIDELASAIPDHMFDYIWFDCCYMMGIETVYQLRDKCEYIGGYPTEDWSPGMNYDATLPLLARVKPDLAAAGEAFFDFYNSKNLAVTVTVLSTSGLERLAQAAADIYAAGKRPESADGLMNYSRLKTAMYDFGQFTKKYLDALDSDTHDLETELDSAIKDITVYAGCSTNDFNNKENAFDPEMYSGLSCFFPGSSSRQAEVFYRSLDWAQRVKP